MSVTDREWREASDLRPSRIGLIAIVVLGAGLRFWALGQGIPFALGRDEPEVLERAVNMMKSGSLHPHFFDYPALYMYLQMIVACARFVAGAIAGTWVSLDQAAAQDFYLWGRALTALLGAATVLLVFHIGMRWGARHALLAAGLMAVLPLHVAQSHYVLTDVPLTFCVTLTLLLSLAAHERATLSAFALSGVAAGLAAAMKYTGVMALTMPLLACWMTFAAKPSRLMCALAALAACAGTFLLAAPYTVLDLPAFLNGLAYLVSQYRTLPPPPEPAWILYLKHLRGVFGPPALLLAAAGLVLASIRAFRGPGRVKWALITTFPVVYFAFISDQRIVYGRYLLPITPSLCVLVAAAVISGVSLLRRYEIPRAPRRALIAALTVAAVLPPAVEAVRFDRSISRRSTVELAHDWVQGNVPKGAAVAVETRGLVLSPHDYRAKNFPRLIADPRTRAPREYGDYVKEGYDYVISSSEAYGPALQSPHALPQDYAAYMRLFGQSRELARFTPNDQHPGPEVRIFRLR